MWIRKGHPLCSCEQVYKFPYTRWIAKVFRCCFALLCNNDRSIHTHTKKKKTKRSSTQKKNNWSSEFKSWAEENACMCVNRCRRRYVTLLQYQHFHVLMMWELEFPDTTLLTQFRLNFPFYMYEWTFCNFQRQQKQERKKKELRKKRKKTREGKKWKTKTKCCLILSIQWKTKGS